jgi:hypothetical protein
VSDDFDLGFCSTTHQVDLGPIRQRSDINVPAVFPARRRPRSFSVDPIPQPGFEVLADIRPIHHGLTDPLGSSSRHVRFSFCPLSEKLGGGRSPDDPRMWSAVE